MYQLDVTIHRDFGPIFQSFLTGRLGAGETGAAIIAFTGVDIFEPPAELTNFVDRILPELRSSQVTVDDAVAELCDVLAAISIQSPK